MNRSDKQWDHLISDPLKADPAHRVPSGRAERTEVDPALSSQRRESGTRGWAFMPGWRRRIVIGAACLVLLGSGLGIAAATSPGIRAAVDQLVGTRPGIVIAPGSTGIVAVCPAGLRVVNAAYIPSDLTVRQFATVQARSPGAMIVMAGHNAPFRGMPSDLGQLRKGGGVYEGFASPSGDRYLALLERTATSGGALSPGQRISIKGGTATIHQEGLVTVVELSTGGTVVTVRTNLGRSEALKVTDSLQQGPNIWPRNGSPPGFSC